MPTKPALNRQGGAAAAVDVNRDADLTGFNTFGLPARAARLVSIADVACLPTLRARSDWVGARKLVLGGGSNLVLTGDLPGWVLRVAIQGRRVIGEDADSRYVQAGAGEQWHDFVRWTLAQGWGGLENLSLIPGTVGAAPIQNIGAYGVELERRFHQLEAVSLESGEKRIFHHDDCAFGYRDSCFKRQESGRWLISSVTFALPKRWTPDLGYAELARELADLHITRPTPLQVSDAVSKIRQRKLPDPAVIGNVGSFFKNPVVEAACFQGLITRLPDMPHYPQPDGRYKLAAGWMIEQCGWKGRNLGPVGCFERQALVLVNRGGALGVDVLRCAEAIRADVQARFGVELDPEPLLVG